MRRLKLSTATAVLTVAAITRAELPPPAPAPEVSDLDQSYLLRAVRRATEAAASGRAEYRPPFVPEGMRSRFCRAAVTLRRGGRLQGVGSSAPRQIVEACLEAARTAAADPRFQAGDRTKTLRACTIGIELIGEIQELGTPLDEDAKLRDAVEPGIDGLGLHLGDRELCLTPGDMIAYGLLSMSGAVTTRRYKVYPAAVWLRKRGRELVGEHPTEGVIPSEWRTFRFRTTHFVEREPGGPPVSLRRGVVPVEPEAVTAQALDDAIDRLGRYLHYRQISTHLFSYEYLPATDEYSPEDSIVRQAGALWGLARYARWSGRKDVLDATTNGLRQLGRVTMSLAGNPDLLFLGSFGAINPVELTAQYTLALVNHTDDKQFANARSKFVAGMITLQQKGGMLREVYPPGDPMPNPVAQAGGPGLALLAMARWHDQTGAKNKRIPKVFENAFAFYRKLFRGQPMVALAAWQSQAYAVMARLTHNDDYAAYVYELTDRVAEQQLTKAGGAEIELRGGIVETSPGLPGFGTGACLQGFADALELARHRGDGRRAERYEALVRRATRFVMQLMVRPEECYYILSPKDAVDGVRTTLIDPRLRIDNCQHALIGLMKAREALFGKRPSTATMERR